MDPRLCGVHDGIKHYWIESLRETESTHPWPGPGAADVLSEQRGVVLWKYSIERSRSKRHSRDLSILRSRSHQGEVDFSDKDAMYRLRHKLSL